MRVFRELTALALLLLLIGCVSSSSELYIVKSTDESVATTKRVFIATTRNLVRDENRDNVLTASGRRFTTDKVIDRHRRRPVNFGEAVVSIPVGAKEGEIKYPPKNPNPALHYAAVSAGDGKTPGEFKSGINRALKEPKNKNDRFVIVFTHGYNTSFSQGVYRHAQMMRDFELEAVPVHFSWASAARGGGYLFDLDSALIARDGLRRTLEVLAETNVGSILVVGHSMGALVTMEAMRDLSQRRNEKVLRKISGVVLASADIDRDVFYEQLTSVPTQRWPTVLIVTDKDRALSLSSRLRGKWPRIGQGFSSSHPGGPTREDLKEFEEKQLVSRRIFVMDLGDEAGNKKRFAAHSAFANSKLIRQLVKNNKLTRKAFEEPANVLDIFREARRVVAGG